MSDRSVDAPQRPPTPASTDGSLLRHFQSGSQDAATEIYLRYAHRLHALTKAKCPRALGRHVDTEDIVQSVFRCFFKRAGQGHYDVPQGEELWKLFLVIALNKIRARGAFHTAAKRDTRLTEGGDLLDKATPSARAEDDAAYTVLKLTVQEALERLPAAHRAMIQLRIEGYDVAEIAEKTGRAKRTVERVLQEARKQLSRLLDEHDDHEPRHDTP